MASVYEELLRTTAEDGASAPCGLLPARQTNEVEELMDAWLHERHDSIESRMFLERACDLLGRIVAEGHVTTQSARSARRLLRAISAAQHEHPRA